MRVVVPRETAQGERRVALVPESVAKLTRGGVDVHVQSGAGREAGYPDDAYTEAGASVVDDISGSLQGDGLVVARVQRPSREEAERLPRGTVLVSLVQAPVDDPAVRSLAERGVSALALERVPRITRAQSMDVLSSQSTVAGYKAALVGAAELDRFLPMLTTAAGAIAPAKVFVIGAGVAGLQAIATARRLGAVVSAFDVRAAAAEQVRSLGASFVAAELVSSDAEAQGGYAREQSRDQQALTHQALSGHLPGMDLVITTAQIPGRPAPRLITEEMLRSMKPGSVVVDLAAETGGNCALTRAGETVEVAGVRVIGPVNLPATVPLDASQMFSRNILTLLQHLIRDGALHLDPGDEITGPMRVAPAPASGPRGADPAESRADQP